MSTLIRSGETLFPFLLEVALKVTALAVIVLGLALVLGRKRLLARYWLGVYCLVGMLILPLTSLVAGSRKVSLLPAQWHAVVVGAEAPLPQPEPDVNSLSLAAEVEKHPAEADTRTGFRLAERAESEATLLALMDVPVAPSVAEATMKQHVVAPEGLSADVHQPDPTLTSTDPSHFAAMETETASVSSTRGPSQADSQNISLALSWRGVIGVMWAAGCALMLLRLLASAVSVSKMCRGASRVTDPDLLELFARARKGAGVTRKAVLRTGKNVPSPVAIGIFRPSILLPESLHRKMPPQHLRPLLVHELAHVQLGDYAVNILQRVAESLLFFHPLVWFISFRLRRLREEVCDNWVLDRYRDGTVYAKALMELAGQAMHLRRRRYGAMGLYSHYARVRSRIERILSSGKRPAMVFRFKTALILLCVSAAIVGSLSLASLSARAVQEETVTAEEKSKQPVIVEGEELAKVPFMKTIGRYARYELPPLPVLLMNDGRAMVPAQRIWSDTGVNLEEGQIVSVSAAGQVRGCNRPPTSWAFGPWGPEGTMCGEPEYADKKACALIGKIEAGSERKEFYIGKDLTFKAPLTGTFYLGVADLFHMDNEAAFVAEVKVDGKPVDFRAIYGTKASGEAEAGSPITATSVKAAEPFDLDALSGRCVFRGTYNHRSRRQPYGTSEQWLVEGDEGALTVVTKLRSYTYVAVGDKEHRAVEYKILPEQESGYKVEMGIEEGKVIYRQRMPGEEEKTYEIDVPEGSLFDPNTRPDPYCATVILLKHLALKEGESKEVLAYDRDNAGTGMATYRFRIQNKGKENVTVPAGEFEANHLMLQQLTSGDTWYKKRAIHVTDFWVLDNGAIVKIFRHREPYEVELQLMQKAGPEFWSGQRGPVAEKEPGEPPSKLRVTVPKQPEEVGGAPDYTAHERIEPESGIRYVVRRGGFRDGEDTYTDRTFKFVGVPEKYQGLTYIQTSNDDKVFHERFKLIFEINIPAKVYVAYDDRLETKPPWLETFEDTGDDVTADDPWRPVYSLYAKAYPAGKVVLGPNCAGQFGSMYFVVLEELRPEGAGTTPSTAKAEPPRAGTTRPAAPSSPELKVTILSQPEQVTDIPEYIGPARTEPAEGIRYVVRSNAFRDGEPLYTDRTYALAQVPEKYGGLTYIQTANNDKMRQDGFELALEVSVPVTVYLAHDDRLEDKPEWLQEFKDTGDDVGSDDPDQPVFSLYAKSYLAGKVVLGPNCGVLMSSMYSVVLEPISRAESGAESPPAQADLESGAAAPADATESQPDKIPFMKTLPQYRRQELPPMPVLAMDDGRAIVPAQRIWSDTGLDVEKGQSIEFSTDGQVRGCHAPMGDWAMGPWGPEGTLSQGSPYYGNKVCALIGKIESEGEVKEFYVGKELTLQAPLSGRLYLGVSDIFHIDNEGAFIVDVKVDGKRIVFRAIKPSDVAAAKPKPAPAAEAKREGLAFIDLDPYLNSGLQGLQSMGGNDLRLDPGEQRIADTVFRIGSGVIQLSGPILEEWAPGRFPGEVKGIKVGLKLTKLHILHATGWGAGPHPIADGSHIGNYVIHYEDESTQEIPIKYGNHVRDWWTTYGDATEVSEGKTAPIRGSRRLFTMSWENPHPDRAVTTIDYTSTGTVCAPFLVAMAAETDQGVAAAEETRPALPRKFGKKVIVAADGAGDTTSIQEAIDSVDEHGTVSIKAGTYREHLVISKPVSIEGAGRDVTRIEATSQRTVVSINSCRNVVVSGLTIASGIPLGERSSLVLMEVRDAALSVRECNLLWAQHGITISGNSNAGIDKCLVAGIWGTGISIGRDASATVSNCEVRNCYHRCITVRSKGEVRIENNLVSGSAWHGIRYDHCSPVIVGNILNNHARFGIYASGSGEAQIVNNLFLRNDMSGVSTWGRTNPVIRNNTFARNERGGLEMDVTTRPVVENNIFFGEKVGAARFFTSGSQGFKDANPPQLSNNLLWQNEGEGREVSFSGTALRIDPLFVDAEADNYNLREESLARGEGKDGADIGAKLTISVKSQYTITPEEKLIIPVSDSRDFQLWKKGMASPPVRVAERKPVVATAPTAAKAVAPAGTPLEKLPGKLIFEGTYNHRSRGRPYGTSKQWIKQDEDGAITAVTELRSTTYTASGNKDHRLTEYRLVSTERGGFERTLTIERGKVISTGKTAGKEDELSEISVPEGYVFDPNSRPDPYCATNVFLRGLALKEGEAKEVNAYDWDNSGTGMATYSFRIENKGKEEVTVPAGTFEANHIVLIQLTTGDTWYKKRAEHVTDFWLLDEGTIVRILRHREPYELLLADYKTPSPRPGLEERQKASITLDSDVTTPLRTLYHTGSVHSAAFSPDGEAVVAGSGDGTVRMWDVSTGNELRAFSGHTGAVHSVAFSSDGKKLLTGSYDRTAKLWDTASGTEIRTFTGHTHYVERAAFSPDGTKVATASHDGTAKLWDAVTGDEIRTFSGHQGKVEWVAFSPDGTNLLTASFDDTAKLWDVKTGEEIRTFSGHSSDLHSAVFSPDGANILTASEDCTAKLWDTATGKEIRTFSGHAAVIWAATYSPDGTKVLTGGSFDMTAKLWDAVTGEEIYTFAGHTGLVSPVAFSPDGTKVLTGSHDGTVKLWGLVPGAGIEEARRPSPALVSYVTAPVRSFAFAGRVYAVAFSPDGNEIAAGNAGGEVRLWKTATGEEIGTFSGNTDRVASVAFSPDGKQILSGSWDGTAKLRDAATGEEVRTFEHTDGIEQVMFSPDGSKVLTAGHDGTAKLWDASTGEEIRGFPGHTEDLSWAAFSPDGTKVVTSSMDGTAKLWDAETAEELLTFTEHVSRVHAAAFSPDGKWVLTSDDDGLVKLWDAATGKEMRTLYGHRWSVWCVAFSPDGSKIATGGSYEGTARLWDVASGAGIRTYVGHRGPVDQVAFSPDGKHVATTCFDGLVRLWDVGSIPAKEVAALPEIEVQREAEVFINLEPHVNASGKAFHDKPDNDLTIPAGEHSLAGVDFRVGEGIVWIGGSREENKGMPLKVEGIKVGLKLTKLHFLHATCWTAPEGARIGSYIIHCADGATAEIPLIYGANIRNWWIHGEPRRDISDGGIAWQGINPYAWSLTRLQVQLYSAAWENPQPDNLVETMDFTSSNTECAPYVVAMTAETKKPATAAEAKRAAVVEPVGRTFINLKPNLTAPMKTFHGDPGNDLTIAPGEHRLADVDFRVEDGIIWIRGTTPQDKSLPRKVDGIKIGVKFNRLHFLHSTCWWTSEGAKIGSYIVHYEDGSTAEVPLIYGENIRNWWIHGDPRPDISQGKVAWRGVNPYAWARTGTRVQLYTTAWENPHPDRLVTTVDFVSSNTACSPYLVALTAETGEPVPVAEAEVAAEIIINAKGDGRFTVDGVGRSTEEIEGLLRRVATTHPDARVIVRCDPETRHGTVVEILDVCEKASIANVSFEVTEGGETGNPEPAAPAPAKTEEEAHVPTGTTAEGLYLEGSRLRSQRRTEEALKAWRTLIERFPESNRAGCAAVYMGQLQLSTKDYEGAEESFKLAAEKFGHHKYGTGVEVGGYGYFYLTHVYCETKQFKKAGEALKALVQKYPYASGHRMGDALMSLRAKRWFYDKLKAKGIDLKFLDDLVAEQKAPRNYDKMNSRQLYLVAHNLMREDKDNLTAIKAFLKGVEKFPEESFTRYGAVFALQLQIEEEDGEGAKQTARLMIEKYPNEKVGEGGPVEAIGYYGLGAAHFLAEQYEKAGAMFQKIAEQFPTAADMDGVALTSHIKEHYLGGLKEKGIEVKGLNN